MSPLRVIALTLIILIIMAGVSSIIGLLSPIYSLDESQILYLYSTSAQVIAGIYGLTLTGFIFFRNELSREEFEDETLIEAVENLKYRYFTMLLFVTAISIFTIIMANITLSSKIWLKDPSTTILMNVTQSSFVVNLLVIAYFVFDVISPKRIEKASKKIRQLVDPMLPYTSSGSLEKIFIQLQ